MDCPQPACWMTVRKLATDGTSFRGSDQANILSIKTTASGTSANLQPPTTTIKGIPWLRKRPLTLYKRCHSHP
jgi:hypothetical protein